MLVKVSLISTFLKLTNIALTMHKSKYTSKLTEMIKILTKEK